MSFQKQPTLSIFFGSFLGMLSFATFIIAIVCYGKLNSCKIDLIGTNPKELANYNAYKEICSIILFCLSLVYVFLSIFFVFSNENIFSKKTFYFCSVFYGLASGAMSLIIMTPFGQCHAYLESVITAILSISILFFVAIAIFISNSCKPQSISSNTIPTPGPGFRKRRRIPQRMGRANVGPNIYLN
jgi:hypothetical protein